MKYGFGVLSGNEFQNVGPISTQLVVSRRSLESHQETILRVLCDARGRRDGISERHSDPVLRPQNYHRTSFDQLARSQLEIVFSEQIAQNHEDLQHRVISTDTTSRSAAERKESEGRAQLVVRFGETLRIESLRILPVARSMVRTVHIHNYRRSAG